MSFGDNVLTVTEAEHDYLGALKGLALPGHSYLVLGVGLDWRWIKALHGEEIATWTATWTGTSWVVDLPCFHEGNEPARHQRLAF